jgi:CBS domain-containing protein
MTHSMNAGDICSRVVVVAERETPLVAAAKRMREQHVGCLVVVDSRADGRRRAVGMLTDRDIVTAVVARDVAPPTLRVGDVMSTEIVTVQDADPFAEVLATMRRKGLRRLPVLDTQGLLVGLLTLDDLLEVVAEQMRSLVDAIESEQRRERSARP